MRKVLIANRGEIAVRVIRACRDAGIASVIGYADPDRDALASRLADEAYALAGQSAAETYLRIDKLLAVAQRSGADAVHPGYGFLAENAEFAAAVIDAGLIWIGPPPAAIRDLGDKVTARRLARQAGAPLVPGTTDPVNGAAEVLAFAEQHGLPVAIKAAFGGGGRGLRVARTLDEIPEQFDAAVREAVAAFGRGECFVERYLDRPRHVEAQVLADQHGEVVVVGTRDCTLQRRHQKLVEEAPAPFLSDQQRQTIHDAARAICRQAGYQGAGTVEFLVGSQAPGAGAGQSHGVSFLEVNTRLQVEHPVTEETTGIDLVREQFRIAAGEPLGYSGDPVPRGHSFEFRINCEDPGRDFLPTPGTVSGLRWPGGPGVRVDSGVEPGTVVGGGFDSMLAKLIVTGATREQALQRARRALAELELDGMPTVVPFHRLLVRDPAFTQSPMRVHTRWIETEFAGDLPPQPAPAPPGEPEPRQSVMVEVAGKRLEVSVPAGFTGGAGFGVGIGAGPASGSASGADSARGTGSGSGLGRRPRRRGSASRASASAAGDALTSPLQGTIVKLTVADGDQVREGDPVAVLEAMKMEQPLLAHRSGTIAGLRLAVGDVVSPGAPICTIQ